MFDSGTDKCSFNREIWKEKIESEVNNIRNGQNEVNVPPINNSNNLNSNQILENSTEFKNSNNHVSNFYFQNNMNDNDNYFNNFQDEERRIKIEEALNFSSHSQSPVCHGMLDS